MKAPLSWLSRYVTLPDSVDELATKLIMSGTEIEEIVRTGQDWEDVIVGRVVDLVRPEGAQRLQVATVDDGRGGAKAVTAAPNIRVGQLVPVVRVGGKVPRDAEGHPFRLEARPLMGITGEAMVLSAQELGVSQDHAGILVLPDEAEAGVPLSTVLGEVTIDASAKGRPDESSMLGIAREIAAITGADLQEPDLSPPGNARHTPEPSARVEVDDPDLCLRYTALRIEGLIAGPSPSWLAAHLEAAGVRAINNIVDVTNFVMLELGQPIHAFDWATIPEGRIIVRRARPEETMVTLDGAERQLPMDTLLICDADGPTGIAGIMGGARSEVSGDTRAILLESANFDRINIRRSARRLGLRTEASSRFERGVAPELTELAIRRCLHLLGQITADPLTVYGIVDVRQDIHDPNPIELPLHDCSRLLGMEVSTATAQSVLRRLGFQIEVGDGRLTVTPPYWRRDVEGVADLAEEIARIVGYDQIPETLPGQDTPPVPLPPDLQWEEMIRETLWGLGLSEVWTDSLCSPEDIRRLFPAPAQQRWEDVIANPGALRKHGAEAEVLSLLNPPSRERRVLRLTLLPALLDVVARNLKHTREHLAFFELARTFFPRRGDLPYQRRTLAIVLAGDAEPKTWNTGSRPIDFFDLKGVVGAMMGRLGLDRWRVAAGSRPAPSLHPGRRGLIFAGDDEVGYMGELHPVAAAQLEIEPPVRACVAEIDLDALFAHASAERIYRPISRFPGVRRDIAVTLPLEVEASELESIVRMQGGDLLREARIVDVYRGEAISQDRKSIALALEFQSDRATLTQDEVQLVQDRVVAALARELGAELRG